MISQRSACHAALILKFSRIRLESWTLALPTIAICYTSMLLVTDNFLSMKCLEQLEGIHGSGTLAAPQTLK